LQHNTQSFQPYKTKPTINELFSKQNTKVTSSYTPILSKLLTNTQSSLPLTSLTKLNPSFTENFSSGFLPNTFKLKSCIKLTESKSITKDEYFYINSTYTENFKVKNTVLNLNELNKAKTTKNYPLFFNFNLENNLNLSKQHR
jgi:hypothetical protein